MADDPSPRSGPARPLGAFNPDFSKPPREVRRYFDAKGLKPSFHWQDVGFDEHAMAFTVAKSAGYDVLADLKRSIAEAIEKRQDFAEWRKGIEPVLKAKGWWGKTRAIDPQTGKEVEVQLGSPRRLRTIYWANVRTAYAAGNWERIQVNKEFLPFLIYVISTAAHKRLEHLEWVGTIAPVDDAWWQTHYPPNGWNCQCRVRQISEYEAREAGYDPDDPPALPDLGSASFVNKRTGEVSRVPNGVDPGWGTNPGKTRAGNAANFLSGSIDALPTEAQRIATADLTDSWLFRKIAGGEIGYDARSSDAAMRSRGRIAVPFAVMPEVLTAAIGATSPLVRLSVADATKQVAKRAAIAPADYATVQQLLDAGEAIRQGERDLVVQGEIDGARWMAAFRRPAASETEIFLKSFHRQRPGQEQVTRTRGEVVRDAGGN